MSTQVSDVVELARTLIARESITPQDSGCQELLAQRLSAMGFDCRAMPFGDVSNLWATLGDAGPTLMFAGHTDVVPTGPLHEWNTPPFEPVIQDGMLYGRGAADMKGSIAAMIIAAERFVARAQPAGRLAFLITSDEEGPAVDGTVRVVEHLRTRGESIEFCVVGEPTSSSKLGDTVRNGRRGSLSAMLRIRGVQGHVAYPHLTDNPIHRMASVLDRLSTEHWDSGNEFFPPTSFQVSNLNAGTGAENVVPGEAEAHFNFRFSSNNTPEELQQRVVDIVSPLAPDHEIKWRLGGKPFLTQRGQLTDAVSSAIRERMGVATELSTGGGTSDGRFIAELGTQVVELGPVNATIHQINECVAIDDLDALSEIYLNIIERLLGAR